MDYKAGQGYEMESDKWLCEQYSYMIYDKEYALRS